MPVSHLLHVTLGLVSFDRGLLLCFHYTDCISTHSLYTTVPHLSALRNTLTGNIAHPAATSQLVEKLHFRVATGQEHLLRDCFFPNEKNGPFKRSILFVPTSLNTIKSAIFVHFISFILTCCTYLNFKFKKRRSSVTMSSYENNKENNGHSFEISSRHSSG